MNAPWLKTALPLLQAALGAYASGSLIKRSTENAKSVAIQSSVIASGTMAFLGLLLASIIMVFVDLGRQFETHEGVHFSGMMLSALYLATLGLLILGMSVGMAKFLTRKKTTEPTPQDRYEPLIAFGQELLKQLAANLNTPQPSATPEKTQTSTNR